MYLIKVKVIHYEYYLVYRINLFNVLSKSNIVYIKCTSDIERIFSHTCT